MQSDLGARLKAIREQQGLSQRELAKRHERAGAVLREFRRGGGGAAKVARGLLHTLKPAMVVGFGGYPSLPTLFAARRAGIPYVLHEQNAVLGRANLRT